MADMEVHYITLSGGKSLPAEKAVCPICKTLDLGSDFNTSVMPWVAECPEGHTWSINPNPDA